MYGTAPLCWLNNATVTRKPQDTRRAHHSGLSPRLRFRAGFNALRVPTLQCVLRAASTPTPSMIYHPAIATQGEDPTDLVPYAAFETKMLEIMASRAWDPDPPEVLLRVSLPVVFQLSIGHDTLPRANRLRFVRTVSVT